MAATDTEIKPGTIVQFQGSPGPDDQHATHAGKIIKESAEADDAWAIEVAYPRLATIFWSVRKDAVSTLDDWTHVFSAQSMGCVDMRPMLGEKSKFIICASCGERLIEPQAVDASALPKVGDLVPIWVEVKAVNPGVGLTVEIFSKTDQYNAEVREGHLDPKWREKAIQGDFDEAVGEMVSSLTNIVSKLPDEAPLAAEAKALLDQGRKILGQ